MAGVESDSIREKFPSAPAVDREWCRFAMEKRTVVW